MICYYRCDKVGCEIYFSVARCCDYAGSEGCEVAHGKCVSGFEKWYIIDRYGSIDVSIIKLKETKCEYGEETINERWCRAAGIFLLTC